MSYKYKYVIHAVTASFHWFFCFFIGCYQTNRCYVWKARQTDMHYTKTTCKEFQTNKPKKRWNLISSLMINIFPLMNSVVHKRKVSAQLKHLHPADFTRFRMHCGFFKYIFLKIKQCLITAHREKTDFRALWV